MKQKQTHKYRKQTCGWGRGAMQREFGISGNTLLHTEWINKKILLYSTGNYIQCPVINHHGEEYKTRMCMFVQLNHCDVQQKVIQHCQSTILQ